jgi:hypothetical protein
MTMTTELQKPAPPDPRWINSPGARFVEYSPTREDYIAAVGVAMPPIKGFGFVIRLAIWVGVLLLGLSPIVLLITFGDPPQNALDPEWIFGYLKAAFLTVLALVALRGLFGWRQRIEKQVDRLLAQPEHTPGLLGLRRVTIAPRGCLLQLVNDQQTYLWNFINRVIATESHCILLGDPNIVIASIPRAAFSTEHGFSDFVETCQRFKESATKFNHTSGAGLDSPAHDVVEESTDASSTEHASSHLGALSIESANAVPRAIYTNGEEIGLYLVTRGVINAFSLLIVGPILLLLIPRLVGWPRIPAQYQYVCMGILGFFTALAILHDVRFRSLPYRCFVRWRTAIALQDRPDRIVSPDQPGAFFVQVVPREHWVVAMRETATDQGWLAVDLAKKRLLFEGVCQRWIIPASCIESCREFSVRSNKINVYVILVIRDADRIAELPLLAFNFDKHSNRVQDRRQVAAALSAAIAQLGIRM